MPIGLTGTGTGIQTETVTNWLIRGRIPKLTMRMVEDDRGPTELNDQEACTRNYSSTRLNWFVSGYSARAPRNSSNVVGPLPIQNQPQSYGKLTRLRPCEMMVSITLTLANRQSFSTVISQAECPFFWRMMSHRPTII